MWPPIESSTGYIVYRFTSIVLEKLLYTIQLKVIYIKYIKYIDMIRRGGEKGKSIFCDWTRKLASRDGVLDNEGKKGHALGFIDRTKKDADGDN